jgi:predicted  nucleic acid-binding Zn-ribbon protein
VDFLSVFLALQGLETRRRALRAGIASAPQKVKAEQDRFHREQAAYEEESARRRDHDEKRLALEEKIAQLGERVKKDKERMTGVQNNVEYQALLREMDHAEREKAESEAKLLAVLQALEESAVALAKYQSGFDSATREHEANLHVIAGETAQFEKDLAQLESDRSAIAAELPHEHIHLYEKLAGSRAGLVVVPAQAGCCGGCHVKLRPAILSQLRHGHELIRCDSCSRILYLPERLTPPAAKAEG